MNTSDKPSLSVKTAVLYGAAILIVAFVGVVAGQWFGQWRAGSRETFSPADWEAENESLLARGDLFPDERLLDLDSNEVRTWSQLKGTEAIVLFITPLCEPCAYAVEEWREELSALPADVAVWAIAAGSFEEMRAYREKLGAPFPLFCDPQMRFARHYEINHFPTLVGLNAEGRVALVVHGFHPDFGPRDAYAVMAASAP